MKEEDLPCRQEAEAPAHILPDLHHHTVHLPGRPAGLRAQDLPVQDPQVQDLPVTDLPVQDLQATDPSVQDLQATVLPDHPGIPLQAEAAGRV